MAALVSTHTAKATFIDLGSGPVANQGHPALIVAAAIAIGVGDMNLIYGGRVANNSNGGTLTNTYGTFTVTTTGGGNNSFLTFTMNTGYVLAGVALHAGGGSSDEFWSDSPWGTSGVNEGPFSNGHGLSNFDVLVEPRGANVPDGGTTVMLLGGALSVLGMARRYIKS